MKELNYISDFSLPNKSAYAVHVMKICDNFAKNGFKVNLKIYFKKRNLTFSQIKKIYLLKNHININYCFERKVNRNIINNIYFGIWCKKNIKKNSLVLSRSIISALILILFNHKVILEIHHEMSGFTKILYNLFFNFNFLKNLRLVFIHANLQKNFDNDKKRSIVLDDCVELEDFKVKKNVKKRCVYTGSLSKGKGIELISKLAINNPKIEFLVYGNIDTLEDKSLKLIKNLKFKDYVNYNKIPDILSSNLILLMPYQNKIDILARNIDVSNYISPLKLFEYLASSNVIIASKLPVYAHILRDNYNCIMCKPKDVESWSKKIREVLKKPKKFNKIKKNSYNTAKNYTWNIRSRKIINFAQKNNLI